MNDLSSLKVGDFIYRKEYGIFLLEKITRITEKYVFVRMNENYEKKIRKFDGYEVGTTDRYSSIHWYTATPEIIDNYKLKVLIERTTELLKKVVVSKENINKIEMFLNELGVK